MYHRGRGVRQDYANFRPPRVGLSSVRSLGCAAVTSTASATYQAVADRRTAQYQQQGGRAAKEDLTKDNLFEKHPLINYSDLPDICRRATNGSAPEAVSAFEPVARRKLVPRTQDGPGAQHRSRTGDGPSAGHRT